MIMDSSKHAKGQPDVKASEAAPPPDLRGSAQDPPSVDTIRDILFGAQMKTYEQRFDALEELLREMNAALSRDLTARLEKLEQVTRAQIEELRKTAAGSDEALGKELQEMGNDLRRTIEQAVHTLQDAKADRLMLGQALAEVAARLADSPSDG